MNENGNPPSRAKDFTKGYYPEANKDNALLVTGEDALIVLASATDQIANFLTGGGLVKVLSDYAKAQTVKDILGGLAAKDGRNSLDARTIKQNAVEIVEAIEAVYAKYQERKNAKEPRDPEIHQAVETDPGRQDKRPIKEIIKEMQKSTDEMMFGEPKE